jgi:glycosyltransferase involved in cell wall biosynthesis
MRIVMDYRPALRARSGVGEYVHQLADALTRSYPQDRVTLFTSSWKDRPPADLPANRVADYRVPVRVLNFTWHNLEWPPVEWLTRERCDVAFSPHPLLLPTQSAAQVVMIHDLDFLVHPERTGSEIRRDYPRLAASHARRARRVVVPSPHTAKEVSRRFDVPTERIVVCPAGPPRWQKPITGFDRHGYVLFMGTLEPRKNPGGLLTAYRQLIESGRYVPNLVIGGQVRDDAREWLEAINAPPLVGHVERLGYVAEEDRQRIYAGARALVLPSFDEGFGMVALEAMSLGIPVIASAVGALPALLDGAGILVDPLDPASIALALTRVVADDALAARLGEQGRARARKFSWDRAAAILRETFRAAIDAAPA